MKPYRAGLVIGLCVVVAGVWVGPILAAVAAQESVSPTVGEALDNFDGAIQDLKEERDALKDEIQNMKVQQRSLFDQVRARLDITEEEKDRTQQELIAARGVIDDLTSQREAMSDRLDESSLAVNRVQDAIQIKDSAIMDAQEEATVLRKQLDGAEASLEKAAAKIQKLEAEKEAYERETGSLRDERKRLLFGQDDELTKAKLDKEKALQELAVLGAKYKAAEEKIALFDDQKDLFAKQRQEAIDALAVAQATLKEKTESLTRDQDDLKRRHADELERLRQDIADAQAKAKSLEGDRKLLENKLSLVEEKLALSERKVAQLETDRIALVKKPAELGQSLVEEKEKTKAAEKELARREDLLKQERLSSEKLRAEIAIKDQELKTSFDEVRQAHAQAQSLQRTIDAQAAQIKDLEATLAKTVSEAQTQAKTQEGKAQELAMGLHGAQEKLAILQKEREELVSQATLLNKQLLENNMAMSKNVALEKENKLIKAGMDKVVKSLQETEAKYKAVSDAYEKQKSALATLEEERQATLTMMEEAKLAKQDGVGLNERVKIAETKLRKLLDTVVKIQDENEQLKEDAKTRVNPAEFKEAAQKSASLGKENEELKTRVAYYEKTLDQLRGEKEALTADLQAQKSKTGRMEEQLKVWESEKRQWSQSSQKTQGALADKEVKLGEVSDGYRKVADENDLLRSKVEAFPRELASLNAKMERLAKENGLLHYNLGVIYTEKELYDEAIVEFEKALEVRPDDAYAHYNLGIIYSQYEINERKAVEHFQKYLKVAPNDKDADLARRYVFTREAYESDTQKIQS